MEVFDVRLLPTQVQALRVIARKLAYRRGRDYSWADLLRAGADWVVETDGEFVPAVGATKCESVKETT